MSWECPAIDHGVAIFPDGRIRPCCQVSADYSKPMSEINNHNRFADLKTMSPPEACRACWAGANPYKNLFTQLKQDKPGIQFLDIRNSNQCNLKCRVCNPHFSNQWAKELKYETTLLTADIAQYTDHLLTENLVDVYFCGGEPLIMKDHYRVLEQLIHRGTSKQVSLRYNTNCTVLTYKDKNIFELWKHFKRVSVSISIDAAGEELNYIRSGSNWQQIKHNIEYLIEQQKEMPGISIVFAPTVSLLNIWFLPELYTYAQSLGINVHLNILTGPDYLSLTAVYTDTLKQLAREKIQAIKQYIPIEQYRQLINMTMATENEYLFTHALRHILLLDQCRSEKLFDMLPFKDIALELTVKNNEYE
jgi:sulfatase maturation enzyme AslB (radical SAM superfamily)